MLTAFKIIIISVPNNLTKVATVDPREIKKIGADTHRLPLEIEIENPYRDAVILNEMAKATSKDEVGAFIVYSVNQTVILNSGS